MDKRMVSMLSTFHNDDMLVKRRWTRSAHTGIEEITKPVMIEDYNQYMGGVDLSDQMLQSYGYSHRLANYITLTDYCSTEIGHWNGGNESSFI